MKLETIDALIDKFTQTITLKLTDAVRVIAVFLTLLSACFLLTLKLFWLLAVLCVILVGEVIYLTVTIKKKALTRYCAIGVSAILMIDMILSFNIWLFFFQGIIGTFEPVLLLLIIFYKVLSLALGFLYTRRCVNRGTVSVRKTAAAAPAAMTLAGIAGYYMATNIIGSLRLYPTDF